MPGDETSALRLALMALVASTGPSVAGRGLCAALLDQTVDLLQARVPERPAGAVERLAGLAAISEICGACAMCPRGRAELAGLAPPPPGPPEPPRPLRAP